MQLLLSPEGRALQGTIYFHMATKHPKIILDENAYLVLRKEVGKTVWMCAKYFGTRSNRCKSKLVTQGRNVFVTGTHNHDPTVLEPATGLSQRVNIIRGYIYFDMATKNPKIILDEYQYLIYRKDTHKTVWMCTHYFRSKENRCKSRLVTTGRNVTVSADLHNHERSVKPERYSNMLSQVVYIIRERIVYFVMGMKNPKIIVDEYDFLIYRKEQNQTVWMCTQYFNRRSVRCKCKIITSGRKVTVIGQHVHEPRLNKDKCKDMMSQSVDIERMSD
ncbi:hypothetical protein HUJ05_001583 [Dendroctonus ponderosae]|nr:hypothetical protein HUJ05_001583 [Dendroctonus ponderosae]